jgi:acylphosphatase
VEAVFEGEEEAVLAVIEFCKVGPKGASVSGVDVNWEPHRGEFEGFCIAY